MNIARFINFQTFRRGVISFGHSNGLKSHCSANKLYFLNQNNGYMSQIRSVSTYEVKSLQKESGLLKKIFKKIPFLNIDRTKLRATAYMLYEGIADTIDYVDFFEKYDLPDTFYSWFAVTELYIWMLSVRGMAEGDHGRYLRNYLVEALWADVTQRVKKLNVGNFSAIKDHILELSEQLQASFIAYDEGLQSNDMVLAGALWRRLYNSEEVDMENLEKLVKYVRKQVLLLESVSSREIFVDKHVKWEPIDK